MLDSLKVPGFSFTTWPFGQLLIAFWMAVVSSPPLGESVVQIVVRVGIPSGPSGSPSWPSERIPGFHCVVRSDGITLPPGLEVGEGDGVGEGVGETVEVSVFPELAPSNPPVQLHKIKHKTLVKCNEMIRLIQLI